MKHIDLADFSIHLRSSISGGKFKLCYSSSCDLIYWVGTHDEVKRGGGIVSWFLDRKMVSLKEAVEREREEKGGLEGSELEGFGELRFEEVGNGEGLVLE